VTLRVNHVQASALIKYTVEHVICLLLLCVVVGIRPYKCEMCGVAFTQKNNLTRHMQIHGGKFQYKCSYDTCNFATRRYEVFKQHMMQHGSLPFQCRLCDSAYFFQQVVPFQVQFHLFYTQIFLWSEFAAVAFLDVYFSVYIMLICTV